MILCENTCCLKYTLPPTFLYFSSNYFVLLILDGYQNQNFFDNVSYRDKTNKFSDKDNLESKTLKSQYILGCE